MNYQVELAKSKLLKLYAQGKLHEVTPMCYNENTMDKELLKRYAVSTILTFLSGFAAVMVLGIDVLTMEGIQSGAFMGLVILSIRGGLKAVLESWLAWRSNRK